MDTSATAAVLFCDVVGSTARQSRVGDRGADELRHRLFPLLQGCVAAGGGRVVKTLGDGLMAVFERSTIGALECAVRMHAVASEFDPDDPLELRVGISIGEVLEEDGDWFGTPVVEAARLCDAAGDGRTLAHSVVASLVGSRGQHFTFSDVGERTLKGLPDALPVIEVTGGTDAAGVQLGAPSPSGRQSPARDAESSTSMRPVVGAGVVLVLVGAVAAVWAFGGSSDGSEGALDGAASTGEASGGDPAVLDYTPVASEQECPDGLTVNLPDVRCGAIEVPENRNDDDSRTISVHYAMTPALGTPSADPVVLMGFNEHLDRTALREVADVYALSIRGFDSRHRDEFRCPALASAQVAQFAARQDDPGAQQAMSSAAAECAEDLRSAGVDPEGYNWRQVALDIRDLAIAEDLDRINVATEGYVALSAVQFARASPGRVNALVLANPVAPGESAHSEAPRTAALELDHLDALCASDAECRGSFGDLRTLFDQRAAELAASPVPVSTRSLDGEGPFEVLLDELRLGSAVSTSLRAGAQVGLVPASLRQGSPQLVAAVSINDAMKAYVAWDSSAGADLSFRCSYDAQPARVGEAISESGAYVPGAGSVGSPDMCDVWGVESMYGALSQELLPDVPVLVAEGGLAAAGVHDWGAALTERSDTAVLVRFDTLGEDLVFDPPPCLAEMRKDFIVDPLSVSGIAECERESPPIEWVTTP